MRLVLLCLLLSGCTELVPIVEAPALIWDSCEHNPKPVKDWGNR